MPIETRHSFASSTSSERGAVGHAWTAALAAVLILAGAIGCVRHEPPPAQGAAGAISLRDRFFDVATVDGETVVVVGNRGRVLRSVDGGASWRAVETPVEKSLLRIDMRADGTAWAVGQSGSILASDDFGASWRAVEGPTGNHLFGLDRPDGDTIVACGDRATFVRSDDGGTTWTAASVPRSEVGVTDWVALAIGDPIYYDVRFPSADHGWLVGDFGNVRETVDGGETWLSRHQSLLGQEMPGATRPARDALDLPALFRIHWGPGDDRASGQSPGREGWVSGVGGLLLHTGDSGRTWRLVDSGIDPEPTSPLFELARSNEGLFVFGAGGTSLFHQGGEWRRPDLGLPFATWIVGARFAAAGDDRGRRGFAVGGRGQILRTDDGGRSWSAVGWSPG